METIRKRKPGGGRKNSKPGYDSFSLLQEQLQAVVDLYDCGKNISLQVIADSLDLNPIKVRKLLITAGVYESDIARLVNKTFDGYRENMSYKDAFSATMNTLNLSRSSVASYLPYEKGLYFPKDTDSANLSVGAERIRRMRRRKAALNKLQEDGSEEALREAVVAFEGYRFHTYSGLPFSYKLRKGKDGAYTKELWIDRCENSKSLTWSSILLAFRKLDTERVYNRPRAIGDIRGISYIYSMLWRFGLVKVPSEVEIRMKA